MTRHTETIEIITRDEHRRRWSAAEKEALVCKTYEPGMSVSLVARHGGVSASLLFTWRRLERYGALVAVGAGEAVVPASQLAAARALLAKLQRVLGKKTMEIEMICSSLNRFFTSNLLTFGIGLQVLLLLKSGGGAASPFASVIVIDANEDIGQGSFDIVTAHFGRRNGRSHGQC